MLDHAVKTVIDNGASFGVAVIILKLVVADGISSFKLYLTYQYKLDDPDILRALQQLNHAFLRPDTKQFCRHRTGEGNKVFR